MAAILQCMRNGEGIGFIAEEMGLDDETEPIILVDSIRNQLVHIGVGGIGNYSTSVFLIKLLRYNYIPTI